MENVPLRLASADNQLFAILRRPVDNKPKVCVVMLNSGMQNRVGPQRLYWKFAQQVASHEIAVLRVDLAGVGDSQSDIYETHFDTHNKKDVSAAIDYVLSLWPDVTVVLQGLCAGSRVAFKAAAADKRVAGILAWSTTIVSAAQSAPQSPLEPEDRLSQYVARENIKDVAWFLLRLKFLNINWWRKRFPGFKGLSTEIKMQYRSLIRMVTRVDPMSVRNEFLDAVDNYLQDDRKVIFAYGTKDFRPLNEFKERFPEVIENCSSEIGLCKIANGTHTFSSTDAQQQVIARSEEWLSKHFITR